MKLSGYWFHCAPFWSYKKTWHHGMILSYMSIYSDLQHQNPKWKNSSTTNEQWSTPGQAAVMSEACDRSCWQHPMCKDTKVWQLGIYPLSNLLLGTPKDVLMMHYWILIWYNWCITVCVVQIHPGNIWFIHCIIFGHLGRKHSRSRPRKNNSGWAWSADCKWHIYTPYHHSIMKHHVLHRFLDASFFDE